MTRRPVRAVLADLDDTLFDHAGATRRSLARLCEVERGLAALPFEELAARHHDILEELHLDVLAGRRTIDDARDERFRRLLRLARTTTDDDLWPRAQAAAAFYRRTYQETWATVPGAVDLLTAIRDAGVRVAIVTNNSTVEQRTKLDRTGLAAFVDLLVTSEDARASKPDPRIFAAALAQLDVERDEAVMFGDAWSTDVAGALAAGLRVVWFNRWAEPSPDARVVEVRSLEPAAEAARVILG